MGAAEGARISAGVSPLVASMDAAADAFGRAKGGLGDRPITLAMIFFTGHHTERLSEILIPILAEVGAGTLLGSSTETVVGEGKELEGKPGLSIWLAHLPETQVEAFSINVQATPDGTALVGFPLMAGTATLALLLADGFTFPTQALLQSLNGDHPNLPVIGGQASGGQRPGDHALIVNDKVMFDGAVGALLSGGTIGSAISQGCRPIGDPYVITACEGNIIQELGGKPALDRLRELIGICSFAQQRS